RVIDLRVNAALDVKWIREAIARVRDRLDAGYLESLASELASLEDLIERAARDPHSVDAAAFQQAKEGLDHRSVRLHEEAIASSLRDEDR
ncbi:MAG: hypothetical protein VXY94_03300, partial [Planctomycetota bacterium]|nr:hypothetical protein [Planctomycetota bacterium]